jgi:hypothetical protein
MKLTNVSPDESPRNAEGGTDAIVMEALDLRQLEQLTSVKLQATIQS